MGRLRQTQTKNLLLHSYLGAVMTIIGDGLAYPREALGTEILLLRVPLSSLGCPDSDFFSSPLHHTYQTLLAQTSYSVLRASSCSRRVLNIQENVICFLPHGKPLLLLPSLLFLLL